MIKTAMKCKVLCKANHEGTEHIDTPLLYEKDGFLNTFIFHFVRIIHTNQYQFVSIEFIQDYSGYQKKLKSNLLYQEFIKRVFNDQTKLFEILKSKLSPMFNNETITI
jgi:hypothetical protein